MSSSNAAPAMPAPAPYDAGTPALFHVAAAALVAALLLLRCVEVGAQRAVAPFRITAVKAMLFSGQTGMFSADIFGPSPPALQNVRGGEMQSTATLIVVETAGEPDAYAPGRRVALTATASGRVLLDRAIALGRPGADGKFYTAFWLYDTGCTPVALNAHLVGQAEQSSVRKTIDFRCGD
jgi:hypothetical protein